MFETMWGSNRLSNRKISYGRHAYIKKMFGDTLKVIKDYYSSNYNKVSRPNPIVKLIELMPSKLHDSNIDLYLYLDEISEYYSNLVGFNTTIKNNNKLLKDIVIDNANELFIIDTSTFNFNDNDVINTSLTCLSTTLDNIILTHPTRLTTTGDHINVYKLHPVKLVIGYVNWAKKQNDLDLESDPARYVYEVVYVNLLDTLIDHALLNRYMNYINGIETTPYENDNVFLIRDYSRDIYNLNKWTKDNLVTSRTYYSDYINNLPVIIANSAIDIIDMKNIYYNRFTEWIIWLSRLDIIIFLIENVDDKINQDSITDIKNDIQYTSSNRIFKTNISYINSILKDKVKLLEGVIDER